jgi:hypothetical protein
VLNHAILRALAKNPAERFSSAAEFRQILMPLKETVRVRRPIPDRAARPFVRMPNWQFAKMPEWWRSRGIGTAAALALATTGAVGFSHRLWPHRSPNPPVSIAVHPLERPVQKPPLAASAPPQPVSTEPPLERAAPSHIVTKRRARSPVVAAATKAEESFSTPSPAFSNFEPPQTEKRPVAKVGEPQLVLPEAPPVLPQAPPAIQPAARPPVAFNTDFGVAPPPGTKSRKSGISKFWHLMRGKKSSSENDPSVPPSEHP